MLTKTAIALAAASIAVGGFAIAPAMANYAGCVENPAAKGCPGEINQNTNANSYKVRNIRRVTRPVITASCDQSK